MSPRLLAATLLALGFAGTAFAAQPRGPEPLSDAGRHAAVADLASPVPAKADAEAWPMTESWTIPSAPPGRIKSPVTGSLAMPDDAAPKSSLQSVADGNGNTPRLVQGNANAATSHHAPLGEVLEHRPDGKLPQAQ